MQQAETTSADIPQIQGASGRPMPPVETRFKKGQSGNPGGKPKGLKSIKSLIEQFGKLKAPEKFIDSVKEQFPNLRRKLTLHEAVALKAYQAALSGESWAVQFLAERGEGKVPTNFNMHASGLGDIIFQVANEEQKKRIVDANAAADDI